MYTSQMTRSARLMQATLAIAALVVFGSTRVVSAQSCYTATSYGGASTVNLVNAIERAGTLKANMNALENNNNGASFYQLSNDAGFTQILFATEIISDSAADNDRAPFGLIFINPTNSPVTITQVDLNSDSTKTGLFRSAPAPLAVTPATGWAWVSNWDVRWTGSIVVPAHSGLDFIVEAKISNVGVDIPNDVVVGSCVTNAGNFTATGYATDVFVPAGAQKVATAVVAFDNGSFPRGYVTGLTSGVPNTLSVRVQEWANNQAIASGMKMNITIPAGWSNVSVVSSPAPWNGAVTITQPTATADGLLRVTTTGAITKGTMTSTFQFSATPPVAYANSVFNMHLSLDGTDTSNPSHPVRSVCDGVVQVLPQARTGINVEFLSPALSPVAPVRSADFEVDFNSINGFGTERYNVDVYNLTTAAWESLASIIPGSSDSKVTRAFAGTGISSYLDASNRMKVRINSPDSSTTRTLRVDYMVWNVTTGWQVDGAAGNNANRGTIDKPLKTIAAAASRAAGGDAIYVVSSGVTDPGNVVLASGKNGTSTCPTLFQGLADLSGNLPRVVGSNPTSDTGFDIEANYATVDSFEIDSTQVALYAGQGAQGTRFTNNIVHVPDVNYGILLSGASNSTVLSNRVSANASRAQIGVWDYSGSGNVVDGNKITGFASVGIWTDSSLAVRIQRNILKSNYIGVHLARVSGTALLYNNTIDSRYVNAYSETSAVTSRNNILVNGTWGWRWNLKGGGVNSNFDDVFGNTYNYGSVTAGANSISANPSFVQTTDPTLSTYYKLNAGSPCVNAGTNVGLPANGTPDIGAVEN